uniref:NADH-ubiquinone oxidoreductase chain 2 n=1 Tax=Tremoctopus violaceus TaxID=102883 RepID=A0A3Q8BY78_9MOLL|nr:NADH dehydrogenase subunit 2 [Tremoctopus violaceus]ATR85794.1 NADH dehydrogenase subunit 2 [Tremoctopus violaceus]WBK26784.1 NADH dehydrogenase subunit 2 [Tremoctopus violaceus]
MNNKFFPANFMLISMLMMGTIMSLSSCNWLMMWMGLELNLMGILPLMNIKSKNLEIESSMKYFIIQSFSSSIFIISSMMMFTFSMTSFTMFNNNMFSSLMILSLLMKLGSAPFHLWLPSMCKFLSWMTLFLILTWQKLAPLFMLSSINLNFMIIMFTACLNAILGSIQAINQTNIQLIMTYSSISHMSWMLPACYINMSIMLTYLCIYALISLNLFIYFSSKSNLFLYSLTQHNSMMNKDGMLILSLILSLSGIPPTLGFLSKLLIMILLINMKLIITCIILFMGTLISLYFYLNLSMILFIKSFMTFKYNTTNHTMKLIFTMNLLGTFMFLPMLMIYAMNIFN